MIGNASKLFCYPDRMKDFWAGDSVIPVTVELQPSNICNQRCSYCTMSHDGRFMPGQQLHRIITECEELGIAGVVISGGGEPLLGELRRGLDGTSIPCGLITSGGVLRESDLDWSRFAWVRFSVDSCRPATYRAIRGADISESLAMNMTEAVEQTFVGVQMVICRENIEQCREMAEWAKSMGASYLQIRPDEHDDKAVWPTDSELLAAGRVSDIEVIVRRGSVKQLPTCHAGHFSMTITADGRCWVCSCGQPRAQVGDLGKFTLREVVLSETRRKAISRIDATQCPRICKGAGINAELSEAKRHCQWL